MSVFTGGFDPAPFQYAPSIPNPIFHQPKAIKRINFAKQGLYHTQHLNLQTRVGSGIYGSVGQ